jgi:hypothetical protein
VICWYGALTFRTILTFSRAIAILSGATADSMKGLLNMLVVTLANETFFQRVSRGDPYLYFFVFLLNERMTSVQVTRPPRPKERKKNKTVAKFTQGYLSKV